MNAKSVFSYRSYAKINLNLYIWRPDPVSGLHPIQSEFQLINLFDTIQFHKVDSKQCSIQCDNAEVPTDSSNLIHKAYLLFKEKLNHGFEINITKRIPLGGGLGGGSSNAALMIRVCNELLDMPLSTEELNQHALSIGSDVPFFLHGGRCNVSGLGEQINQLSPSSDIFLLILPKIHCNTGKIFKMIDQLDLCLNHNEIPNQNTASNMLLKPACHAYPDLNLLIQHISNLPIPNVELSGSGSTLFIRCSSSQDAQNYKSLIKNMMPNLETYIAQSVFNSSIEPINEDIQD